MKTILLAAFVLATPYSWSNSLQKEFPVLLRSDEDPVLVNMPLADLVSTEAFEGSHFKIVKGKSDEAIRFDAEEDLTIRAATAYYHLTKARNYFVNKVKSNYVMNHPQMTIRLEITNKFSDLGHFQHDNLEPQYNNALTVPGGQGLSGRGIKPWGTEIWFRPTKRIHLNDIKINGAQTQEFKVLLQGFRNQMHMQTLQKFLILGVVALTQEGAKMNQEDVLRLVGSSVLLEAGYRYIDPITKVFSRKWYWLDTAMVPEIIYHEYAHAALADSQLKLSHSSPIIEGMADFFAGQIADSPKLADNIKKYNTYNGKDAKRKQNYILQFETNDYANTDFVFGVLWSIKEIVGEEQSHEFMFELRNRLNTSSSIRVGLVDALLQSCEVSCKNPFTDKLRILKALNSKGI